MEQPDFRVIMEMIHSPAGQRLMELVQQQDSPALQKAVAHGDINQAQSLLSSLIKDPETQELLDQLRGK